MAWTYATLSQAVQDYTENANTTFVSYIDEFIRTVERDIVKQTKLPVFKKNSLGAFTSGNEYLSMPSDFLSVFSLSAINSGSHSFLQQKDVSYIRELYPDSSVTGVPKYYGQWDDNTVIVGPTPGSNYTAELHYFHLPQSIVDAGTSWLGTNAENALLFGTLVQAYIFMKGEQDLIDNYQAQYTNALGSLKSQGEGYNTTDYYRSGSKKTERI